MSRWWGLAVSRLTQSHQVFTLKAWWYKLVIAGGYVVWSEVVSWQSGSTCAWSTSNTRDVVRTSWTGSRRMRERRKKPRSKELSSTANDRFFIFAGSTRILESPGFFPAFSEPWKALKVQCGPRKSWKLKFKVLESPRFFPWIFRALESPERSVWSYKVLEIIA